MTGKQRTTVRKPATKLPHLRKKLAKTTAKRTKKAGGRR